MTHCRYVFFLILWLFSAYVMVESNTLFAQANTNTDQKAVNDTRRELGQSTMGSKQFPWYSNEMDDAAFVPFPKERKEKEKPEKELKKRESREPSSFWTFFAKMSYTTIFVIGLIVILLILALAWFVLFRNRDLFRKLWKKEEYQERQRRIETLPEEARDMFDDLIGAARRAFEAGQYRNALIYYFSHQLVWLDMHQLIRMHKGKTNHEYARELKNATEVLSYYEKSMMLFESVYYGDHQITRLLFLDIWERRNEFSQAVREEKQRRDEAKLQRLHGSSIASHQSSLTLKLEMPDSDSPLRSPSGNGLMLLCLLTFGVMFGTSGCRENVQTAYIPPPSYDKSINGISVFNDITVRRGHALRSGGMTNAYAKNGDVLIWFARQTGCPKDETVRKIETWLNAKPDRTFVYVGRAFESTYDYWSAVEELTPKENLGPTDDDRRKIAANKQEAADNLRIFLAKTDAAIHDDKTDDETDTTPADDEPDTKDLKKEESNNDEEAKKMLDQWAGLLNTDDMRIGDNMKCDWFKTSPRKQRYRVTAISGDANWTSDINAEKLHLTCFEEWAFGDDVEPLLVVDGETAETNTDPLPVRDQTLVARKKVGQSQAIFVANAGFLLNYPLVNHEHRKLAGRLIGSLGEPKKRVFVYIGHSDLDIEKVTEVSDESPHVLLTLLHIWPLSIILCHVIVLCAAFFFYKWPIFGRPKREKEYQVTDFSKHIDAYATLLAEAKDDDYTTQQIAEAFDRQKRELF